MKTSASSTNVHGIFADPTTNSRLLPACGCRLALQPGAGRNIIGGCVPRHGCVRVSRSCDEGSGMGSVVVCRILRLDRGSSSSAVTDIGIQPGARIPVARQTADGRGAARRGGVLGT